MRWVKTGFVYSPPRFHPKLWSHAANPLAVHLRDDTFRIFFSSRDRENRSSVGYVDIDLLAQSVVGTCSEPAFTHGAESTFYSHGVSIGNLYCAGAKRYILFMGWKVRAGAHWWGEIGRLILDDDLALRLDGSGPFMTLDEVDPISLSYPWVIRDGRGVYQMWYGSTRTWDAGNGEMVHVIHHASSSDGQTWQRKGLAVPFAINHAQAFSRPCVIGNEMDGYHMWFSYRDGRGTPYRIGYARSGDGEIWQLLLDKSGIDVSPSGWDSEMIEYPYVFAHKGNDYLLYNGNGYGESGFGLAMRDGPLGD